MHNHNNNTHDIIMQSQTFLNIIRTGTKIAAFLDKTQFCDDEQQRLAQELRNNWTDACTQYANCSTYQDSIVRIAIEDIDNLFEYLSQVMALLRIAIINEDFIVGNEPHILFNYLSVLDRLINDAYDIINKL